MQGNGSMAETDKSRLETGAESQTNLIQKQEKKQKQTNFETCVNDAGDWGHGPNRQIKARNKSRNRNKS